MKKESTLSALLTLARNLHHFKRKSELSWVIIVSMAQDSEPSSETRRRLGSETCIEISPTPFFEMNRIPNRASIHRLLWLQNLTVQSRDRVMVL